MSRITVVSLGTGDPEWLNRKTMEAVQNTKQLFIRTDHHGITDWLNKSGIPYRSFDSLYTVSESFEQLNRDIAHELWKAAKAEDLVYGVPDALTDGSIDALFSARPSFNDKIDMIPGTGIAGFAQSFSREYISEGQVRTATAASLAEYGYDPDISLLITELNDPMSASVVKEYLEHYMDDEDVILYFTSYDVQPVWIPLFELDRQKKTDHMSCVLIPGREMMNRRRYTMHDLEKIMDRLRDPQNGCPWDRKQTPISLKPYIIEEAWETAGAIDSGDPEEMASELGDLLFQIIFQSSIGKSKGDFDIRDVISSICTKMIRRHPHVFSGETCQDERIQAVKWEEIKRAETGHTSVAESLLDVSPSLPGLRYAQKMIGKSRPLRQEEDSLSCVLEEMKSCLARFEKDENRITESALVQMLFLCARICSLADMDGEILLHQAADQLKNRYNS